MRLDAEHSGRMRLHAHWICSTLLFATVTFLLTYPMGLHLRNAVLDEADPLLNAWILGWEAYIIPRNPSALYDANDFYPYSNTLAYSETLLGQAPVALPIIWLTHNPILAMNILWITSFILSGLGMYALVYHFTHSIGASIIAGLGFAFNPFRFAHLFHLQLLSAQWIPFILIFLDRLLERHRWSGWIGLTFFFNLQLLSCYYYALFTAVATGVLLFGYLLFERQRFNRRLVLYLLLFAAVTAAIQIPLSTPYFVVAKSMGFERTLDDAIRGGADLTDFITAPPANLIYGHLSARFRHEGWWEHVTFPGVVIFTMALIGVLGSARKNTFRRKEIALYLLLTGTAFILSLGPALRLGGETILSPLPYRLLFDYVPGSRAIRQPARFHIITMAGMSVLAGFGAAWVEEKVGKFQRRFIMSGVLGGLMVLENLSIPLSPIHIPLKDQIPPVYKWLSARSDSGPVLELPILMDVGATEAPRLYYSVFHRKRLVNGYGGFIPPVYAHFLFFDREFPHQPYHWIVGLGIRYIVLHRHQYAHQEIMEIEARLSEYRDHLRPVADFGDDLILEVIHPMTGLPNHPLSNMSWDSRIVLLGYTVEPTTLHPGEEIKVRLFWQSHSPMRIDYTVFVHVVSSDGALITQHDGQPANGTMPTSTWRRDQVVLDTHVIQMPDDMPSGTYEIRVGVYDLRTTRRLPILKSDGMIYGDFLPLGHLQVAAY